MLKRKIGILLFDLWEKIRKVIKILNLKSYHFSFSLFLFKIYVTFVSICASYAHL